MTGFFIPVHPVLARVLAANCTVSECSHWAQCPSHHTHSEFVTRPYGSCPKHKVRLILLMPDSSLKQTRQRGDR